MAKNRNKLFSTMRNTTHNWFTVKVKYTKQLENGTFKRVTEPYLVFAVSFTDAEARIYEELATIIRGEFDVLSITRTELHDIFEYDDDDVWWWCKVSYSSVVDEGKAKTVSQRFLVSAKTANQACDRLTTMLKTLLVEDFVIPQVTFAPIVDFFPHFID